MKCSRNSKAEVLVAASGTFNVRLWPAWPPEKSRTATLLTAVDSAITIQFGPSLIACDLILLHVLVRGILIAADFYLKH